MRAFARAAIDEVDRAVVIVVTVEERAVPFEAVEARPVRTAKAIVRSRDVDAFVVLTLVRLLEAAVRARVGVVAVRIVDALDHLARTVRLADRQISTGNAHRARNGGVLAVAHETDVVRAGVVVVAVVAVLALAGLRRVNALTRGAEVLRTGIAVIAVVARAALVLDALEVVALALLAVRQIAELGLADVPVVADLDAQLVVEVAGRVFTRIVAVNAVRVNFAQILTSAIRALARTVHHKGVDADAPVADAFVAGVLLVAVRVGRALGLDDLFRDLLRRIRLGAVARGLVLDNVVRDNGILGIDLTIAVTRHAVRGRALGMILARDQVDQRIAGLRLLHDVHRGRFAGVEGVGATDGQGRQRHQGNQKHSNVAHRNLQV